MAKLKIHQEASEPATPAAGEWILYFLADGLYVKDDQGTVAGPLIEAAILDHGALPGLSDDDHAQYLLATGLRAWIHQASTPSTPAAGTHKLYFKTDGNLYQLDSMGQEVQTGAGSGLSQAQVLARTI